MPIEQFAGISNCDVVCQHRMLIVAGFVDYVEEARCRGIRLEIIVCNIVPDLLLLINCRVVLSTGYDGDQ